MRFPLSVTKGSPAADRRSCTLAPQHLERFARRLEPKGDDLDRDRRVLAQAIHELRAVDDDHQAPGRGGDDLLAQQGAAQALDQVEGAPLHLVGAVDREVDLAMLGEGGQRDPRSLCLRGRPLRGRNAGKAQALPVAGSERIDGEGRRRTGAEAHDHAVLDQPDRRFRRGALQGVTVASGRGDGRTHDRPAPAIALARIASMAAR